jgi:putative FmdB family regulatory protein
MPIYEYEAVDSAKSCEYCRNGFEYFHKTTDATITSCPKCGSAVRKRICLPNVGFSKTGFDRRAREAGFHKLQRTGKGEYEAKY